MDSLIRFLEPLARISPTGTFIGAIAAATALVFKVLQDRQDLRRKQAEVARLVYNDLHQDEYSMAALIMLDYPGWRHTTRDFERVEIFYEDVKTALTTMHQIDRPHKELLVRRAFDTLFAKLENVIVLARRDVKLVRWSDFASLFGFYIHLMREPAFSRLLSGYANQFGCRMIVELIESDNVYPIPAFPRDMMVSAPSNKSSSE